MADKGGALRLGGALLVAFAPPALLAATHWKFATHHSVADVLIGAAYELAIIGGGIAVRAWRILEADWAKSLATWVNSTVTRWLAGYGPSYRQGVRIFYHYLDELGVPYRGESPVAIEEVFVDVGLVSTPPGRISGTVIPPEVADKDAELTRFSILRLLDNRASGPVRLMIIGPPGSGKTTLLRHVALNATSRSRPEGRPRRHVPVLLSLPDCSSAIVADPNMSLPVLIEEQVGLLAGKPPSDWFKNRLAAGDCVVMFDGADEIADRQDRQAVLAWIHAQATHFRANDYIVTSRPLGNQEDSLNGATVLQVRELTPAQIWDFVDNWYRAAERNPLVKAGGKTGGKMSSEARRLLDRIDLTALGQLAANPLLLTMMCRVNRHSGGELPTTRPELYQEFCRVLLANKQRGNKLPVQLTPDQKVIILRQLALTMMERHSERPAAGEMAKMIRTPLRRISPNIKPEDFLANIRYAGLLAESEHGDYSFVHQTFREYLAAVAIIESGQLYVLLANVANPRWHETSMFYAAIKGADRIVEACLKSDTVPALALAFACAEVARDLDSGLRSQLRVVLEEATDPKVPAVRRRLAAAVIAMGELRPVIRLASNVLMCDAPVSRELFEIFASQSRGEFPSRRPDSESIPLTRPPALGVKANEALAFLTWLNGLSDSQRLFRLPTRAEAADPRFAAKNRCVWLAAASEPQELDLWVPRDSEHPYVVPDGELRKRADADGTGCFGQVLAMALTFALVHTLTAANTLLSLRRTPNQTLFKEIDIALRNATDLAVVSINGLPPGADGRLHRVLKNALNTVKGSAQSPDFGRDLASAVANSANIALPRALDLAIDLARFRASDLETSLGFLNDHVGGAGLTRSAGMLSRPPSRARDLTATSGRPFASTLDRALDQILRWAKQSEADLDVPMCLQFARQIPVEGKQRTVLDAIWGSAFSAIAKQREGRVVLPGSLARISAEAGDELSVLIRDSGDSPPADRLVAVAAKVHRQVEEITDPDFDLRKEKISAVRLGAVALAANLARDPEHATVAGKYLDLAIGVTTIERQLHGQSVTQESMILVKA